MTPEEVNRTMEFILQSQARLAAAQEQDRQDRIEFEAWARRLMDRLDRQHEHLIQVVELQSRRLDRQDKFYRDSLQETKEFQRRATESQQKATEFQMEALRLLHIIVDRLPPLRWSE